MSGGKTITSMPKTTAIIAKIKLEVLLAIKKSSVIIKKKSHLRLRFSVCTLEGKAQPEVMDYHFKCGFKHCSLIKIF
jgi:hypothetical protein